jgi:hypothetical protein
MQRLSCWLTFLHPPFQGGFAAALKFMRAGFTAASGFHIMGVGIIQDRGFRQNELYMQLFT